MNAQQTVQYLNPRGNTSVTQTSDAPYQKMIQDVKVVYAEIGNIEQNLIPEAQAAAEAYAYALFSGVTPPISATLDMSNPTIYNAATNTLTIPTANLNASVITLAFDNYNSGATYAENAIVVNPVNGQVFQSVQNGNTGNALSNNAWWVQADVDYNDVGQCPITNIIGLSETHNTRFETQSGSSCLFVSVTSGAALTTQIVLLSDANVTVTGRATVNDFIVLACNAGGFNYYISNLNF